MKAGPSTLKIYKMGYIDYDRPTTNAKPTTKPKPITTKPKPPAKPTSKASSPWLKWESGNEPQKPIR